MINFKKTKINKMNKKTLLSLALFGLTTLPFAVSAQPKATISDIGDAIDKLTSVLWTIFGGIAVVMFVVAGILFLTASGDPEKVKSARNAAIWGVAGIIVGILAYSIVKIVENALLVGQR
jgi:FtsH-binding integral membrane protein